REGGLVVTVDDEPGDLIGLVGNHGLRQEGRERQVGERILGGDPLLAGLRRDARELIAAAQRRGFREQRPQVPERVAARFDGRAVRRSVPGDIPRVGLPALYSERRSSA